MELNLGIELLESKKTRDSRLWIQKNEQWTWGFCRKQRTMKKHWLENHRSRNTNPGSSIHSLHDLGQRSASEPESISLCGNKWCPALLIVMLRASVYKMAELELKDDRSYY